MKNPFNEFEKSFITEALKKHITQLENGVEEMEKDGKRSIFAKGYFTTVGNELIKKVNLK